MEITKIPGIRAVVGIEEHFNLELSKEEMHILKHLWCYVNKFGCDVSQKDASHLAYEIRSHLLT